MNNALWLAIIALFGLAACDTVDTTNRPSDFPQLKILPPIYAPLELVQGMCMNKNAIACARIDFEKGECQIYFSPRSDTPWNIKEEEDHCMGYDHPKETMVRDAWNAYKGTL